MNLDRRISKRFVPVTLTALFLVVVLLGVSLHGSLDARVFAQDSSGITAPASGSTVSGVVRIDGTATIGNFQRYELYFKPVAATDSDYQYIDQGTEEVINGELGFWDTTLIQPDIYTLRLRVVQNDGNYSEFFAENITVDPNISQTPPPSTNPTPVTPSQPTPTVATGGDSGTINVSRTVTATTSRTITMLGRGVAAAAPDRVQVRLYVAGAPVDQNSGSIRTVSEVDLQQVAATLQSTGVALEDVRVIPFSRRPDGSGVAGEVRFTYRQPSNLTSFLNEGLNRLSGNPNVRIVDVAVQYGVADCAALEVEALRAAILTARARAEPMATVLNVRLGPVLSVSENVAAVPLTGSCLDLLDDTAFLPLGSDTPSQVEVAVTLAVTFVMDTSGGESTTPSTAPTPDLQASATPTLDPLTNATPTPDPLAAATPTPSTPRTHIVQPGETLDAIAITYGITVEALRAANGLSFDQTVAPGTVLTIPGP